MLKRNIITDTENKSAINTLSFLLPRVLITRLIIITSLHHYTLHIWVGQKALNDFDVRRNIITYTSGVSISFHFKEYLTVFQRSSNIMGPMWISERLKWDYVIDW